MMHNALQFERVENTSFDCIVDVTPWGDLYNENVS